MKYCIHRIIKDNIPGFRDKEEKVIACFNSKKEAEQELKKYEESSIDHSGYGAGAGTIDTWYFIEEEYEMTPKEIIVNKFNQLKNQWLPTSRAMNHNILGNSFEDLMGIEENNNSDADFKGIEFKTQRNYSKSYITLFSKSPNNAEYSNTKLRNTYGYPDPEVSTLNRLSTTISCKGTYNRFSKHAFQLKIDENKDKLSVIIRKNSLNNPEIESFIQEWNLSIFRVASENKLKNIAYISGDEKSVNGQNYVKFTKLEFITGFTYNQMIKAFKDNKLKLDIRLGVYKSGDNYGKTHDHGSGFRITEKHLREYADFEEIV